MRAEVHGAAHPLCARGGGPITSYRASWAWRGFILFFGGRLEWSLNLLPCRRMREDWNSESPMCCAFAELRQGSG